MLNNVISLVAGFLLGSAVNMGLVTIGPMVIPAPEGVDVTDVESLKASAHLFEARHFLFPWLAHAMGSLVGGFVAFKLAASHHKACAISIGAFFMIGGLMMVSMMPSPTWFIVADIGLAYIPAALLGAKLASRSQA
ncbi:MAG: hypothetical protein QGF46_06750 [Planctomycetota bacterium]|jgi:hypothetical protein|nr:hypothetical protein [Planctomycetota bacterium]